MFEIVYAEKKTEINISSRQMSSNQNKRDF